jgi:hypothetical protein
MAARRSPATPTGDAQPSKRGEAAWRAERDAIADRNERASKRARERRQQDYEAQVARRRAAELQDRARGGQATPAPPKDRT